MSYGEILENEISELAEKLFIAAFASEDAVNPEAAFRAAEWFIRVKDQRFNETED